MDPRAGLNLRKLSLQVPDDQQASLEEALHCFSHQAMATVFEIFCAHPDPEYARQAARASFGLADRLEQELSRFIENSDISRINNLAAGETVRVSRWTMECLLLAQIAHAETGGAFDISLGTGLQRLELLPRDFLVRAGTDGIRLDLGGIGKGYALDRMAEVLVDWDIHQVILHAGYSSVLAMNPPSGWEGWPLTMTVPDEVQGESFNLLHARQRVLSASGLRKGDHIRNPREGQAAPLRLATWVAADIDALVPFCRRAGILGASDTPVSDWPAAVAEVFSTAFMILGRGEIEDCCRRVPGLEAWLIEQGQEDENGKQSVSHVP
jgi:thiamine biosynthesis lipoprotein